MLQEMRDKLDGWIKWAIVIVLIVVFALWGMSYYLEADHTNASKLLTVNGESIDQQNVHQIYQQLLQEAAAKGEHPDPKKLQTEALTEATNQVLVKQAATSMGMAVSSEMAWQVISNLSVFQEKGTFSAAKFQQILASKGVRQAQFERQLKDEMLNQQLQYGVFQSNFILPDEITALVNLARQKRDFEVLMLPLSQYAQKVSVSEAEEKAYYQDQASLFMQPEKISLNYITLSLAKVKASIQPDEQALKAYYDNHLTSFQTPEKRQVQIHTLTLKSPNIAVSHLEKAEDVLRQVLEGKTEKEKLNNLDPDVVDQEVTRWVAYDAHDELAERAFQLKDIGAASPAFVYKNRHTVIKLLDITKPKTQSFVEAKKRVRESYINTQAQAKYQLLQSQLSDLTSSNTTSLALAAKTLGLKVEQTPFFTKEGLHVGIASHPEVIQAAFSDAVKNDQMNSQVISLPGDRSVVIRAHSYQPAEEKSFKAVQEEIAKTLKKQKAAIAATADASELLAKLQARQTTLPKLAQAMELKVSTHQNVIGGDKTIPPALLRAVYQSFAPATAAQPQYGMVLLPEQDAVALFGLQKVTFPSESKLLPAEKEAYSNLWADGLAMTETSVYLQYLNAKAKIEVGHS